MIGHANRAALDRSDVADLGFAFFVKLAWPHVCAEPMVPNWHIDEICDELQSVAEDRKAEKSRDLALCIPPASSKSLIASILWQPWVWTWWPESQWITATYEQGLATDHSAAARDLVLSDWYQERWPLKLKKDAASSWANEKGGWRRAVGTGGAITGKHGHFHLGDDLIKEQDSRVGTPAAIASIMEKANGFWFKTMITRKVGQALARVLIGQRLHIDDPPGVAIRDHGYQSIVFPMRFDPQRADPRDHRTVEGELLCEARIDAEGVAELERTLGPSGASSQLQQEPIPPGGQLLKPSYFENRYAMLPGRLQAFCNGQRAPPNITAGIYGDMTFKGKPTSDFVVLQFWIRYLGEYWLVDQVRGQWTFKQSKAEIVSFQSKWPMAGFVKLEDAANAPALESDLKDSINGIQLAPMGGGCLARTQQVEGVWSAGQVRLPATAPWMGGSDGFIAEHLSYDGLGTRHDDMVATSSLALLDLSQGSAMAYASAWEKVARNG